MKAVDELRMDEESPETDWSNLRAIPGIGGGLEFLLDLRSDTIDPGTIGSDHVGVTVSVYHQDKYPSQDLKQIVIRPGHER